MYLLSQTYVGTGDKIVHIDDIERAILAMRKCDKNADQLGLLTFLIYTYLAIQNDFLQISLFHLQYFHPYIQVLNQKLFHVS